MIKDSIDFFAKEVNVAQSGGASSTGNFEKCVLRSKSKKFVAVRCKYIVIFGTLSCMPENIYRSCTIMLKRPAVNVSRSNSSILRRLYSIRYVRWRLFTSFR